MHLSTDGIDQSSSAVDSFHERDHSLGFGVVGVQVVVVDVQPGEEVNMALV